MAHKDGSGYYTKVVLFENGQSTWRRIQRLEWQDEDGRVHFLEGRDLPADFLLYTGHGVKDRHIGTFLGIKTTPQKPWLALPLAKADLKYVIIGAALAIVLKGALTLAAVTW